MLNQSSVSNDNTLPSGWYNKFQMQSDSVNIHRLFSWQLSSDETILKTAAYLPSYDKDLKCLVYLCSGCGPIKKIVAVIAAVAENESSWEHQTLDWPEVFEYWCRRWMMYKATQLVNDIFLPHVAENTGIGPITSRICRYLEQDIYLYIIESTVTSRIVIDTEFVINTTMPATFQHR